MLIPLRDAHFAEINHNDFPALYPPIAQGFFVLLRLLSSSALSFKLFAIVCDSLSAWLLRQESNRAAAILFLNPLLILEGSGHGHFESLVVLSMVLLLRAVKTDRGKGCGYFLAMGVWIKPQFILLAPLLFPSEPSHTTTIFYRLKSWIRPFIPATIALGIYTLLAGPSLFTFGSKFQYNALFPYLIQAASSSFLSSSQQRIVAGVLMILCFLFAIHYFRQKEPSFQALAFLTLGLAFSPTVHPWYGLWILPTAALRSAKPWILFTGTLAMHYGVYYQAETMGIWQEIPGLRWMVYLPPLVLALALWIFGIWKKNRPSFG